jgi:PhnB protein
MAGTSITPYLCVHDADAAIAFYQRAFGAQQQLRLTGDDGRVGHANLVIGDTPFMLSDEWPEGNVVSPKTLGNTPVALHLVVDDIDTVFAQAIAAGASEERPVADQAYGERGGVLRDPFGHRWFVASRTEDLSEAEMRKRFEGEGYETQGAS